MVTHFYALNSQADVLHVSCAKVVYISKSYVVFKAQVGAQAIKHCIVDILKHNLQVLWLATSRTENLIFLCADFAWAGTGEGLGLFVPYWVTTAFSCGQMELWEPGIT